MEHLHRSNVVFAIVMALLVVQSSTRIQLDEMAEMQKILYNTCSAKFPVREEIINDLKKSIISDDPTFKCFLKCCLREMSLIDEDGIIDGNTILEIVPENIKPIIEQAVPICIKNVKQDGCQAAFEFISCGVKFDPLIKQFLPF
ncbi:hypothetical protein QTP88_018205 [Uroleucon formosanum]